MAWTERFVDASASGGGTGTSASDPWTLAEAISNSSSGMRVNFKAGLYSNTSSVNTSFSGAVDSPIWWRGYKTTPGDIDGKQIASLASTTDLATIKTTSGGYFLLDPAFMHMSGMCFQTTVSGRPAIYDRRGKSWTKNCRFEHLGNCTTFRAASDQQNRNKSFLNCDFFAESGSAALINPQDRCTFTNCTFRSNDSTNMGGAAAEIATLINCTFYNLNYGVNLTDFSSCINCTFVDITGNAIQTYASSGGNNRSGFSVVNNYFSNIGGYCIGNTNSVNFQDGTILIANNAFHNSPYIYEDSGTDNPVFDSVTDSADSFVDSASGDFTLESTSSAYSAGAGASLHFGTVDYRDYGAIQHQDPTGGSGGSSSGGSSSNTAGTQIYPFRQWVEDDFGGGTGGGATYHPLGN